MYESCLWFKYELFLVNTTRMWIFDEASFLGSSIASQNCNIACHMASGLSLLRDTPLTLMADFCNGYILHAVLIFRLWKSCFMSLLLWHCFLSFLWQWFPIIFSVHSETSTTYLFVMSLTKKIHVRWVACAALEHARKKEQYTWM